MESKIDPEKTYYMKTDGASRKKSGKSACAYYIYSINQEVVTEPELERSNVHMIEKKGIYLDNKTVNEAEYCGLILGLQACVKQGIQHIIVFVDSTLLVGQVTKNHKINKADLQPLVDEAKKLKIQFTSFQLKHIPREINKIADQLCNDAMDSH